MYVFPSLHVVVSRHKRRGCTHCLMLAALHMPCVVHYQNSNRLVNIVTRMPLLVSLKVAESNSEGSTLASATHVWLMTIHWCVRHRLAGGAPSTDIVTQFRPAVRLLWLVSRCYSFIAL
jgi:hypothetical protein